MRQDCKECTPDQPCKKHWQRNKGDKPMKKTPEERLKILNESLSLLYQKQEMQEKSLAKTELIIDSIRMKIRAIKNKWHFWI